MSEWIAILTIACLVIITIQDFKERAVSWFLFPFGFLLCGIQSWVQIGWKDLLLNFGINLFLLVILVLMLLLYLFFRFGIRRLKFWDFLGAGDVLFLVVLASCFSPFNFIVFTITSLLLALLTSLIFLSGRTIPLAGIQAVCLSCFITLQYFIGLKPFNDNWIFLWM